MHNGAVEIVAVSGMFGADGYAIRGALEDTGLTGQFALDVAIHVLDQQIESQILVTCRDGGALGGALVVQETGDGRGAGT